MFKVFILATMICVFSGCASKMKSNEIKNKDLYMLAVQGSVLPVLKKLESDSKYSELHELKKLYKNRFYGGVTDNKKQSSLFDQIINVFQSYWKSSLLQKISTEDGFLKLYNDLRKISLKNGVDFGDYGRESAKKLSNYLKNELEKKGVYSLWGITRPYAEFMAWSKQTDKIYSIDLGDTNVDVNVILMDDFISFGWLGYATFDELHTGGWATKEKLFCVSSKYDKSSEGFKISYLAHEGRHFSDFSLFPNLESTDLEYRAKLTELILSKTSLWSVIEKFKNEAANNRSSSHAFSSFNLLNNLKLATQKDIKSLTKEEVQKYSKKLLDENTQELNQRGALTVKTLF